MGRGPVRPGRRGVGRMAAALLATLAIVAGGGPGAAQGSRPAVSEPKPIQVTPEMVAAMRQVAEQGDPNAQITVGFFYEGGQGVPVNFDEAAIWYEKAAQAGAPRGAQVLGLLHARTDWAKANPSVGLGWLDTAIALGRAEAKPARDRLAERLSPSERQAGESFGRSRVAEIKARLGKAAR